MDVKVLILGDFFGRLAVAYELDHVLRRRKLRHHVPITFVTPEPFLGHMGMGGAGKIRQLLEGAFDERDITYATNSTVSKITRDTVETGGTNTLPSTLSLVIPPLVAVTAIAENVYALGVAMDMAPVAGTPVPVNFPKTGHMTEWMDTFAAADIAARITGGQAKITHIGARCVMGMGDRGIYMAVNPVRPPRERIPTVSEGLRWLVVKRAFERTYLFSARHGMRVPTALG